MSSTMRKIFVGDRPVSGRLGVGLRQSSPLVVGQRLVILGGRYEGE